MKYLKIWTDFRRVMVPLSDDEKGRLFDAMLQYAETGEEPPALAGNERFLWPSAMQAIDHMNRTAETFRENGRKGGRPRSASPVSSVFIPPTVEEVRLYCRDIHSWIDAEKFIEYYDARDWKIRNRPVADWKALVLAWDKRARKEDDGGSLPY